MEKKPFVQPTLMEQASLVDVTLGPSGQGQCATGYHLDANGSCVADHL